MKDKQDLKKNNQVDDSSGLQTDPDDQSNKVQLELEELKVSFAALDNQFKRAVADYQNLEKRVAEGRSELTNWMGISLVSSILPVVSHFDQALASATEQEKSSAWFKGVEMSVKQLKSILKNEGLEEIIAEGQFDPTLHEAVDTASGIDGKILKVTEIGYKIKGKVIKPAKVVVGKKD